jgi:hypothetical protein
MAAADLPKIGPPVISQSTAIANAAPYFDVQDSENEHSDIIADAQLLREAQGTDDESEAKPTGRDAQGQDATSDGSHPEP